MYNRLLDPLQTLTQRTQDINCYLFIYIIVSSFKDLSVYSTYNDFHNFKTRFKDNIFIRLLGGGN